MAQYQSGTQTRRVKALQDAVPDAFVEIHPSLAQRFGIADGDPVTLTTRRGEAAVKARFSPAHPAGHALRPVPLGGHGPRQPADQSGARPDLADAGVQGLRGADRNRDDANRLPGTRSPKTATLQATVYSPAAKGQPQCYVLVAACSRRFPSSRAQIGVAFLDSISCYQATFSVRKDDRR